MSRSKEGGAEPAMRNSDGERAELDLTLRKFRAPVFMIWMASMLLGLIGFGVALLVVSSREEPSDEMLRIVTGLVLACAIGVIVCLFSRRIRLHASERGLTLTGLLGSRSVAWDEVTALRFEDKKLAVFANASGILHRIKVHGGGDEGPQMVGAILARSPQLAFVAWGTGLVSVPRPGATTALPDRVYELGSDFFVEGPAETRIVITEKDPMHATVHEMLEWRLLPAMLSSKLS